MNLYVLNNILLVMNTKKEFLLNMKYIIIEFIMNFFALNNELKNDNCGALLIPIQLKVKDQEYKFYRDLPVDWSISPVKIEDLPSEFSKKACDLVDLFRRKTINLDFECMLYFDYITGEIIYCFIGNENYLEDFIDESFFKNKHIASIHNHPRKGISPPSSNNFQIIEIESEDYEIISSYDNIWILKSKGVNSKIFRNKINFDVENILVKSINDSFDILGMDYRILINDLYGTYLLNYIYDYYPDIILTKVEL